MKKQLNFGHVKAELGTHQCMKTSKPGHYQQRQAWTSLLIYISHGEGPSRDPSGTCKWMQLPPTGFSLVSSLMKTPLPFRLTQYG